MQEGKKTDKGTSSTERNLKMWRKQKLLQEWIDYLLERPRTDAAGERKTATRNCMNIVILFECFQSGWINSYSYDKILYDETNRIITNSKR